VETILLAVGKLRPWYRDACDEYLRRLTHYGPIVERELREAGRATTTELRHREEAGRIARALPSGALVVALARGGTPWTSDQLARQLDRWRQSSQDLALVIGGAYGLAPELLARASQRWSLGPLTLPHQLVRVIVLEQWYRAWTILRGEPYHKGGEP
jgi:23S rRNA (pseudouridine1915-N3)-methyltransferase